MANLHARVVSHPQVPEAGRQFLAELLAKLSDRQLTDLFTVARVAELGHPVEEWAAAFKRKRDQVSSVKCGP